MHGAPSAAAAIISKSAEPNEETTKGCFPCLNNHPHSNLKLIIIGGTIILHIHLTSCYNKCRCSFKFLHFLGLHLMFCTATLPILFSVLAPDGKLHLTIQPFSPIKESMTHSSSTHLHPLLNFLPELTIIAGSLTEKTGPQSTVLGWGGGTGGYSTVYHLSCNLIYGSACSRRDIHNIYIQTVALKSQTTAVSGTFIKVTVSLLRGGKKKNAFACLRGGILRGSGYESRE